MPPSRVPCPKCGANAHVNLAQHSFIFNTGVAAIHCMICGTRKYGEDADRVLAEYEARVREAARLAEATRLAEIAAAEAAMRRSQAPRPAPVATSPRQAARIAARAARVAELGGDESSLCASPWCSNAHPTDRRYCNKTCSDDVARERYAARKRAGA